jgi:DNA-binding response OmpR family regulator
MSRVLVVDDEPEIGQILRLVLESRGHAVIVAGDAIEGLTAALRRCPDVIVLDLMMPLMDGYTLLQQLRADARTMHIRVVVLSVVTTAAARERCMELGAVGFITKPFDPYEVATEIEHVSSRPTPERRDAG